MNLFVKILQSSEFSFYTYPMPSKQTLIRKLTEEITNLKQSPLYAYRVKNGYRPVIGGGSLDAKIMFIGEAPGKNEAVSGQPFVGASGRILDELLASVKLKREDVYITSIVNDRPPENRDPSPKEIQLYAPFLLRQLEIIKPNVIATLGRYSMNFIMVQLGLADRLEPISRAHGKAYKIKTAWGEVTIVPLYHPAVVLYGTNKEIILKDFKVLKKFAK